MSYHTVSHLLLLLPLLALALLLPLLALALLLPLLALQVQIVTRHFVQSVTVVQSWWRSVAAHQMRCLMKLSSRWDR